MTTTNLNYTPSEVNDGKDAIVIVKDLGDIPGGRTLDVSSVAADVEYIRAGHVIVQDNSTKAFAPLGVSTNNYEAIASGKTAVGVLKNSISKKDPRAAILTIGQVNAAASPYPVTEDIKKALPRIQFLYL